MSDENDVCKVCGGMKRIAYTIEFRECVPHSISVDPNQLVAPHMRLCPGHPEPARQHDGKLDECGYAIVTLSETYSVFGPMSGVFIEDHTCLDKIGLMPNQALSLLAWLTQERDELQRLAKEQGDG